MADDRSIFNGAGRGTLPLAWNSGKACVGGDEEYCTIISVGPSDTDQWRPHTCLDRLGDGSRNKALSGFPRLSNIFPKSSLLPVSRPAPRLNCPSDIFGGVAVLSVPLVWTRLIGISGVAVRGGAEGVDDLPNRPPKENVRPAAARRPPAGGGGAGISCILECGDVASSGGGISVEDGRVDEELSRVEVELS